MLLLIHSVRNTLHAWHTDTTWSDNIFKNSQILTYLFLFFFVICFFVLFLPHPQIYFITQSNKTNRVHMEWQLQKLRS